MYSPGMPFWKPWLLISQPTRTVLISGASDCEAVSGDSSWAEAGPSGASETQVTASTALSASATARRPTARSVYECFKTVSPK